MALPEVNADQALGMVSFGLMQRLAKEGNVDLPWLDTPTDANAERLRQLKQRLELTQLAIDTGAPLSTSEVTALLGAKPGAQGGWLPASKRLTHFFLSGPAHTR